MMRFGIVTFLLLGIFYSATALLTSKETFCQKASRPSSKKSFIPTCNETTHHYVPMQCDNDTGSCWCVEVFSGHIMVGTFMPKSEFNIDCASHKGTECEQELHDSLIQLSKGEGDLGWTPNCHVLEGTYIPQQCNYFTLKCWCVDPLTGVKNGSMYSVLNPRIDCVKTFPVEGESAPKHLKWLDVLYEVMEFILTDMVELNEPPKENELLLPPL